ncbi:MAG: carboxypeptidase-like regulatory domain-containing protein [Polyangiales bacterium]|nr:carboxypeptidase regulatory-like domain-containing protein [Myxococcales bacterium]
MDSEAIRPAERAHDPAGPPQRGVPERAVQQEHRGTRLRLPRVYGAFGSMVRVVALVCVGALTYLPSVAQAQAVSGRTALTGAQRLVRLDDPAGVATLALGGQYGFTSSVLRDGDTHHRLAGQLALAVHPLRALSLGVSLGGYRDVHRGGAGPDDSVVGEPRVFVLARLLRASSFSLGLGAELWAPAGDDPGVVLSALSPSVTLYGQVDIGAASLSVRAGYLLDRSARSIPRGRVYTAHDQVSLGVTDADAVEVGLGVSGTVGLATLYAEVALDALVQRGDLPFSASRASAMLGAALTLAERVHLGLDATARLGGYPRVRADAPYRVVPRISLSLTLAVDLGRLSARAHQADASAESEDDDGSSAGEPTPDVARALRGRVVGDDGSAVPRARVVALSDGRVVAEGETDADGWYTLAGLPEGALTLRVEAEGHTVSRTELGPDAGGEVAPLTLRPGLPDGEIRGSVRGLRGAAVTARIRLDDDPRSIDADAEGRFSIAVTPGSHVLHVDAPGYRAQERHVDVEERGVVVIEVHLRPE